MSSLEVKELQLDAQELSTKEKIELLMLILLDSFRWEDSLKGDAYWEEVLSNLAEEVSNVEG